MSEKGPVGIRALRRGYLRRLREDLSLGMKKDKKKKRKEKPAQELPPTIEEMLVRVAQETPSLQEFGALAAKPKKLRAAVEALHPDPTFKQKLAHSEFFGGKGKVSRSVGARIWRKAHPEGEAAGRHWVDGFDLQFPARARRMVEHTVRGERVQVPDFAPQQMINAIDDALRFNSYVFADNLARLAGADPGEVAGLSGGRINGSPASDVFLLELDAPAGKKNFVMVASRLKSGFGDEKSLKEQYRNLLFYRFDMPKMPDMEGIIPIDERMRLQPRRGCPPELATPYLEGTGLDGEDEMYLFTVETAFPDKPRGGVEVNKFGMDENFRSNPEGVFQPDSDQSLKLSKDIIRICAQLFACTYDPATGVGIAPSLSMNNGDVIVDPESGRIRVGSVTGTYVQKRFHDPRSGMAALVDYLVSPTTIVVSSGTPDGWILPSRPESIPHLLEGLASGFEPLFGDRSQQMAADCLRAYADTQEATYDGIITSFRNMALMKEDRMEPTPQALEAARSGVASNQRLTKNPFLVYELGHKLPTEEQDAQTGSINLTTERVDGIDEKYRPLIVPRDLIQAIREM